MDIEVIESEIAFLLEEMERIKKRISYLNELKSDNYPNEQLKLF